VFLTNGKFWLILPGGFIVHHLAGHRLGWFRYDINWWAVGLIAVMGPLASIIIAILFKALSAAAVNSLIQKLIMFNIAYALYSLLPIPPLDGSKTFYGSRMLYAFSTTGIVAAAILLTLNISVGIAVIASFLIGIVLWVLYYIFFESKIWHAG
jgi:Zn-dependent protease